MKEASLQKPPVCEILLDHSGSVITATSGYVPTMEASVFSTLWLTSVLPRRFQTARDQHTRPTQSGFRSRRSCVDHIFNLRRTLEIRHSYQQPTIVCLVEFGAAFDLVFRRAFWLDQLTFSNRYSTVAMFCVISFTSAPPFQRSCDAGSDGSDMLLAVLRAKSSVTSSTRCRLRTGARSEVAS